VAVAPIRREASHRSEMTSQLLLGECCELLETDGDFIKIRCLYDGYEGWCQRSQLAVSGEALDTNMFVNTEINAVKINHSYCRVSVGTPVFDRSIRFGPYELDYSGTSRLFSTDLAFNKNNMLLVVSQYTETPYLWGGKSVFGIDCSGFVQQVFKMFDIRLPRDAYQQAEKGDTVSFLQEVQCGDVAFFDNEDGRITHTGILLNPEDIIHASGKVRVDKIDSAGIMHAITGERTHRLRIIKRFKNSGNS